MKNVSDSCSRTFQVILLSAHSTNYFNKIVALVTPSTNCLSIVCLRPLQGDGDRDRYRDRKKQEGGRERKRETDWWVEGGEKEGGKGGDVEEI